MKKIVCTITTKSHIFKVKALFSSIKKYDDCDLAVLIIDDNKNIEFANSKTFFLKDFESFQAKKIISKYKYYKDKLRWSMKAVFIKHLLQKENYNKVIYIDNDIFFFEKFDFIWLELEENNVLLTPHFYPYNPLRKQNWFEANFRVGLYNAGFFAVNNEAIKVVNWWANACMYRIEKNYFRGLFDDQKYLDLMPVIFEKVKIIKDKACNIAEWNSEVLQRIKKDDKIYIGNSAIVFYHFNNYSLQKILETQNHILKKYFDEYFNVLKKYNNKIEISTLYKKENLINKTKLKIWKFLNNINANE